MNQNYNLMGVSLIKNNIDIPKINGNESMMESLEKASIIHKMVRKNIVHMIKPGVKIYDISKKINDIIRIYTNNTGINGGIAFPPTVSLTNVIAHHSPEPADRAILFDDNVKLDIGVHVNGWSIDSAFTCYFNPDYYILHKATKEALNYAIRNIGIDTYINDISKIITEIVESYEIIYKGNIEHLKVVKNLTGHKIEQYNLHAKPYVYNSPTILNLSRFKEGVYAIEPFVSILSDNYINGSQRNNYRITDKNHPLFKIFNNMIFSDYHLIHYNITNFNKNDPRIIIYPDLIGNKNDMIAQYEHTIYIDDMKKINLSQFDDY